MYRFDRHVDMTAFLRAIGAPHDQQLSDAAQQATAETANRIVVVHVIADGIVPTIVYLLLSGCSCSAGRIDALTCA